MSLIGKATRGGHFLDRQISLREQPPCTLHPSVNHEGVRRATEGFAEMPTERTDAHPGHRREFIETDRFVQPRFDVLEEPADLAARKAPTHDRIAKSDAGIAAQQLHRQLRAQRLDVEGATDALLCASRVMASTMAIKVASCVLRTSCSWTSARERCITSEATLETKGSDK